MVVYSSGLTVMQCDLGCRFWLREEKKEPNNPDAEMLGGGGGEKKTVIGHVGAQEPGLLFSAKASTCTKCASNYTSHS